MGRVCTTHYSNGWWKSITVWSYLVQQLPTVVQLTGAPPREYRKILGQLWKAGPGERLLPLLSPHWHWTPVRKDGELSRIHSTLVKYQEMVSIPSLVTFTLLPAFLFKITAYTTAFQGLLKDKTNFTQMGRWAFCGDYGSGYAIRQCFGIASFPGLPRLFLILISIMKIGNMENYVRQQISAPFVSSCVCANDLSFKTCVCFGWSRVHTVVKTTVAAPVFTCECLKPLNMVRFKHL